MVLILSLNNRLAKFFQYSLCGFLGATIMACNAGVTELKWEWRADRAITHKVVLDIQEVSKPKKLLKSPSFAADLPDPLTVSGKVRSAKSPIPTALINLTLPAVDLAGAPSGSRIALAMVDSKTVVCVEKMPSDLPQADEEIWLNGWECH